MATLVVSIICIAMIVTGGIILTQGMLSSADVTAVSVAEICALEGDVARTSLDACRAEYLTWADLLRVTVRNTGQVKLASFDDWDFFLAYEDGTGENRSVWLPYAADNPGENQWSNAGIGLNGPVEFFEPEILNPGEQVVMLVNPDPPAGANTTGQVNITSPNGVFDTASFWNPGYALLVPHDEDVRLSTEYYYEIAEGNVADGPGTIMSNVFYKNEPARKVLTTEDAEPREGRYVFSLAGITEIPAQTWQVYYRCIVDGGGEFPRNTGDVFFDIDINIRTADGTVRQTLASGAAQVIFPKDFQDTWITVNGTYDFPGYTVVEETDYLEIVLYSNVVGQGPSGNEGYMRVMIDDISLELSEQTRIEA